MEFNEQFLQEMGLQAMPEDQKQPFLDYVQEELEIRIGQEISKGVPLEKLQEFDQLTEPDDVIKWFNDNRPDFREIVLRTIEEMKDEIRANRDRLIN